MQRGAQLGPEDGFLDRLYEASAVPELWPDVLERMNDIAGLAASVSFGIRGADVHWVCTDNFVSTTNTYISRGYLGNDQRTVRLVGANHAGFLRDLDVFTLQEWEADPIRRDLFVPMGFGWGIATWIPVPTGDMLIVHGERHLDAGPPDDETVRRLDALRPHLARAVLLSSRMAFRQMSTAAQILGIVGIPAAVLGPGGRILAANDLLEAMAPEVVQPRPSRIGLASPTADAQLAQALERMSRPHEYSAVQSIPIPARDEHPPCLVHLYPVRRNARDLFSGASTVLLVTPVRLKEVPSASVIQGLFDLTAAEARVARGIGEGLTVEQLSRRDQVSLATVRNQLRSVFDKTGMKRQAELASLLQGISRGGAAGPQAS